MLSDPVKLRFESALASGKPADALHSLARSLRDEGMSQREMYDLFDRRRVAHEGDEDKTLHDTILDTMDRIVGWCGTQARLFGQRGGRATSRVNGG